jgi:hypothetical protein
LQRESPLAVTHRSLRSGKMRVLVAAYAKERIRNVEAGPI